MKPLIPCLGLLLLTTVTARADLPTYLFDKLPVPLKLPPGLIETIPLNHDSSFFGDQMRIVDCSPVTPTAFPGDTQADEVRFGTCGNQYFGGVLMTDTHLTGSLTIQFFPTSATTAHFVVRQNVLRGEDGELVGPQGYRFPLKNQVVVDAQTLSSGDLDLETGYANPNTLLWYAYFGNSGLAAIANVNPKLVNPVIAFPGIRGFAWASFSQRGDGLLDFYFRGSTFLALGSNISGDPVRFPLPLCDSTAHCASVLARGSSLHPHLELDTRTSSGFTPCAPNCPDIPINKTQIFTVHASNTSYGDDFDLRIPELGGLGPGRSELQGRIRIQFGPLVGNAVPFQISTMVPEVLFAEPPNSTILGAGFRGFLLGANQQLHFPNYLYNQHKLLFADEVYNRAWGLIDLASGRVFGEFVYPMYIDQSIIEVLIPDNNGRVTLDPFLLVAERAPQNADDPNYIFFQKGLNGETLLRANLFHHRSFETYCFPMPNLLPNQCWISPAGSGGNLNIFGKIQAAHLADPANPGGAVLSDNRKFTSGTGDAFSYNFMVSCAPAGKPFSFVYTNGNTGPAGGTFTMTHLDSVSCTNSATSKAGPGGYDQVAITGFGVWSKDPVVGPQVADLPPTPRFLTASISVDPANPYAAILVFSKFPGENQKLPGASVLPNDNIDSILSSAENKPATKPIP